MLKDQRNLLWILPLGVLLSLPFWKPLAVEFLNPQRQAVPPVVPAVKNPGVPSDTEMDGVRFEQSSNDGTKEWLLTAERIFTADKKSDMKFEDVEALFFGTAGVNEETRIRSREARYNSETRFLTLLGEVVVRNQKGYEMRTDSLEYLAREKKIRTTSPVSVRGKNIEVTGKSLLYDISTGNYSLNGDVVCRIW